jgi:hypothetical protein
MALMEFMSSPESKQVFHSFGFKNLAPHKEE